MKRPMNVMPDHVVHAITAGGLQGARGAGPRYQRND